MSTTADEHTNRVAVISKTITEIEPADDPMNVRSLEQDVVMGQILLELRKINLYLSEIVGYTVRDEDVEA